MDSVLKIARIHVNSSGHLLMTDDNGTVIHLPDGPDKLDAGCFQGGWAAVTLLSAITGKNFQAVNFKQSEEALFYRTDSESYRVHKSLSK